MGIWRVSAASKQRQGRHVRSLTACLYIPVVPPVLVNTIRNYFHITEISEPNSIVLD